MSLTHRWRKEDGWRLTGSRDLDSSKLQAPGVVRLPEGGYRLFYTAVGPGKPYAACQGYILSAVSEDGVEFRKEPGIRVAPQPELRHMSLRVLGPSLTQCADGRWRMYFEARGAADVPTVIASAISSDMLDWELEEGIRLEKASDLRAPRYLPLADGRARLHCSGPVSAVQGEQRHQVVSAVTSDGINFEFEEGSRIESHQSQYDTCGITAAEVIAPEGPGDKWAMFYSVWQDVAPGTVVPVHPSKDPNASEDFAAASIAVDMAGYRSRIFVAYSDDGLTWGQGQCAIEGEGHGGEGPDAVHAEDMSLVKIGAGKYRMYYAACDKDGNWGVASAISQD